MYTWDTGHVVNKTHYNYIEKINKMQSRIFENVILLYIELDLFFYNFNDKLKSVYEKKKE